MPKDFIPDCHAYSAFVSNIRSVRVTLRQTFKAGPGRGVSTRHRLPIAVEREIGVQMALGAGTQ
jgi:hypothetical protein